MSQKDGVDIRINRFLIRSEGNIKYTYNNGIIAKDEKLASMNFLNALKNCPITLSRSKENRRNTKRPASSSGSGQWYQVRRCGWANLKTGTAAVERKIQLSITR